MIIDSHAHVFRDPLNHLPTFLGAVAPFARQARRAARRSLRPLVSTLHTAQTSLRLLPDWSIPTVERLAIPPLAAGLLLESTAADLKRSMESAGIDRTLVIAAPPVIPNDWILDLCSGDPTLGAILNFAPASKNAPELLRAGVERGARGLKLHPASDGEGVDSEHYRALLEQADTLGLPVIIHTGCIHGVAYRKPEFGEAEHFEPWFSRYKDVSFILAHTNFHHPAVALDLAERYSNLWVETSWQPAEIIGESVRRLGAERVLFGSDWPLVGQNQRVGLARIRDCQDSGTLNDEQAGLILGTNAQRLFRWP